MKIQEQNRIMGTWKYVLDVFKGKIGLARGFVLIAIIINVIWLCTADSGQRYEPLMVLILLIVAWLTGTQVFNDISDLRAKTGGLPIEKYESQTTDAWAFTNHSFFKISYDTETDQKLIHELKDIWRKNYTRTPISFLLTIIQPRFSRLIEDTATVNYRVYSPFSDVRFLRVHKAPNEDELECRRIIAEQFKEANVFQGDIIDYLIPLKSKNSRYSCDIPDSVFAPSSRNVKAEVFPFLDNITHFNGNQHEAYKSVVRVIGRVQGAIQEFSEKTLRELKPLIDSQREKFLSLDGLNNKWKDIQSASEHSSNPFATLINIEKDITNWFSEVVEFRGSTHDTKKLMLHDIHPHNVLIRNDGCILICDFQWFGYFPHNHVAAFTLHRFLRELIVHEKEKSDTNIKNIISKGTESFINIYQEASGLLLEESFRENLCRYIRSSNMEKLFDSLWVGLTGYDRRQRSEERRIGEVKKFIRYMKEAETFQLI